MEQTVISYPKYCFLTIVTGAGNGKVQLCLGPVLAWPGEAGRPGGELGAWLEASCLGRRLQRPGEFEELKGGVRGPGAHRAKGRGARAVPAARQELERPGLCPEASGQWQEPWAAWLVSLRYT